MPKICAIMRELLSHQTRRRKTPSSCKKSEKVPPSSRNGYQTQYISPRSRCHDFALLSKCHATPPNLSCVVLNRHPRMYMLLQTSLESQNPDKKHRFEFHSFVTYHISIARSEETPYSKQGGICRGRRPNVVHEG